MTLSPADFLRLPYPADLTEGGIAHALRLLAREKILYNRLIRIVADFAAELALRRHLAGQDIPFEVAPALPFEDPGKYHIVLAGRRCDVKSFFISYRSQIDEMRRNPEILLNAPALVPSEMDAAEGHADADFYVFAFVSGLKAVSPRESETDLQPRYFLHVLPEQWRNPAHWNPLGELALKSESSLRVEAELCGLDEARGFVSHRLILPPQKRTRAADSFYSLSSIHVETLPAARLGISIQKQTYVVAPQDWKNVWVYGMEILFAGYLTRGEFRRRAGHIPPATSVFQYSRTRVKNLAVPISALRPMRELFERARS